MSAWRAAIAIGTGLLALPAGGSADEAENVTADMMFYVALTGRLMELAVALDAVSGETGSECALISVQTFAARSSALGFQVSQLSMLRRLGFTEDSELRAFARPRHDALRALLPAVIDRDLVLIEGHLESVPEEETGGEWPPRFRELLRDLESTLRTARDMLSDGGKPAGE